MITTLVKLTRSQLTTLQNGGTVGSHTYDPDHCLYMVDDGLELPTESGQYVLSTNDDGESFRYEVLNLTWNEISGKPSAFPPTAHTHSASDITTGTVALARLPVGTAATQVAAGNHTHSAYVNQNAFGNVKVGSTTTAASSTTDTVTFAAGGDLGVSISGKTVSYSITLPTQLPASDVYDWAKAANKPSYTAGEVGAATAHHLYHTWDDNTNYYDSYIGGNMFRIITENMYADTFRFQASTVQNLQYYDFNNSTWTSWNFDLANLFDGNARTGISIPYANRKFRFELQTNGSWPITGMFMLQGTWFNDGGWPNGQKTDVILETRANTSASWTQRATFTLNGVEGMAAHTVSSLHTGDSYYRITITIYPWTTTTNNCPLQRLCLFSNYNGGSLEKISYDGYGNTLTSTIYENGTSLANKYVALSGGTMTGQLTVRAPIFGYEYSQNTNAAAFVFDKPGVHYTGIGSHSERDTIYFGACGSDGAWVDSYKQKWKFNGTIIEDGAALSNKYLGITATATDSSRLNGQTSSYYLNYNNLSNKPSIPSITVSNGVIIFA